MHVRPLERGDLPAMRAIIDATGMFPSALLDDMVEPYFGANSRDQWLAVGSPQSASPMRRQSA